MVVDLPAPFGPSSPMHVPNGTSRSRPSTAVSAPKRLTTPRSLIAVPFIPFSIADKTAGLCSTHRSVRILFTFAGLRGHLEPLVPIARAARDAGHTVAFAPDPWIAHAVVARGFDVVGPSPPARSRPAAAPAARRVRPRERGPRAARGVRRALRARPRRPPAGSVRGLAPGRRWSATRPTSAPRWRPSGSACRARRCSSSPRARSCARRSSPGRSTSCAPSTAWPRIRSSTALSRDLVLSPFPPSLRDPEFPLSR